jgi:hypothetical protein
MMGVIQKTENIPMMCVELNFDLIPILGRTNEKSTWT